MRSAPAYLPVVIIGAPRSGTNMLRDALCAFEGVGTWPCDEINYVWRHGNLRYPSDAFEPECATASVRAYVRRAFDRIAAASRLRYVVEKTCANSLRVGFVDRVLPDAKYVYIVRNGLDVAASAMRRWKAKLDIGYILRKARFVPPTDVPYYALRYGVNRMHRLLSKEHRLASWGPRLENMGSIVAAHDLPEICALQWQACVERSDSAFAAIGTERVCQVRYESFVSDPKNALAAIARFLALQAAPDRIDDAARTVTRANVGKGVAELGGEKTRVLRSLVGSTLARHGY
jgi:hypothetical protein